MAKKRKATTTSLDEVDRTMYASFCGAANSLSQLYSQAMNHQKLSFQAGERHAMEKLYQLIRRQHEGGSRVTTSDVLSYIQKELDYNGEEPSMSPRATVQHQHSQAFSNSGFPLSSALSVPTATGQGTRSEHADNQSKNSVFSNALSSPVWRSLQDYQLARGDYNSNNGGLPLGNGVRSNEPGVLQHQSGSTNPVSSNDSSMEDSSNESTY